jgi:hypothetical protein
MNLRGAHSALITSTGVILGSQNACLRAAFLREYAEEVDGFRLQPDLRASITFGLGHTIEDVFESRLKTSGINYTKEKLIVDPITDKVNFCGHMDFVNEDEGYPYELKSISSTNTAEKVLIYSKPKLENLMQLSCYMVAMGADKAKLCYGNMVYHKWVGVEEEVWDHAKALKHASVICQKDRLSKALTIRIEPCFKIFEISIDSEGIVSYDNHRTSISVEDIVRYREEAAKYLETKTFPTLRPEPIEGDFPVCYSCKWKNECKAWDEGVFSNEEDLLSNAKKKLVLLGEQNLKTLVL